MKSSVKTLLSLLVTAVISVGLLWGGDLLTRRWIATQDSEQVREIFGEMLDAEQFESIHTGDFTNVTGAWKALDGDNRLIGYAITTEAQGYGGKIEVHTAIASDKRTVKGIRIGSHQETPGYGARVTEDAFTDQFASRRQPFYLNNGKQRATLRNGTYRAVEETYDSSGFRNVVTLTVNDGKITAVEWDAEQQNSSVTKKDLSKAGEYVMSETGLPWHEQAEIMENALLSLQDPARIVYQPDTGKTDAYTGATITVSPFVLLADEALDMARSTAGSAIDGVSGATTSSQAVINAVNEAFAFVSSLT